MNPQDLVALVAALVVDRSVVAPEIDRIRAERAAIKRARRIVARCHGLRVGDVPGGGPSRARTVEDDA